VDTLTPEDAPAAKKERAAGGLVRWFVVIVTLYILSTGPVVRPRSDGTFLPLEWREFVGLGITFQ